MSDAAFPPSDPAPTPAVPSGAVPSARPYDAIVVGAGVAGLAFALRLPTGTRIALLTKGLLGESNTRYAQGGLAAPVGPADSPALHEADTLAAGAGLCDPAAVRRLVEGARRAVDWLVAAGTRFDRGADGRPLLGLEAAHGLPRVLHAGGDATGAEIERALVERVRAHPTIDLYERAFALDLLVAAGRCRGVLAQLAPNAPLARLEAPVTLLAAGGAGRLWATTSNPPGATADGLAMALRAAVAVADLEFVQFHPTVLALDGSAPFLVSEAVRGEGAYLRGADGSRFMRSLHPQAELAPRDVVARGIQHQMAADGTGHVWLDLRHLPAAAIRARFPTISRELATRGLDLATDRIPIAPAAHYFIGGIVAGSAGHTSLPGLLALGEAACTGVHGANRLASNSLLEGLVFGLAAADRLVADPPPSRGDHSNPQAQSVQPSATAAAAASAASASPSTASTTITADADLSTLRDRLQRAMSRHVAVVRDGPGLRHALTEIDAVAAALAPAPTSSPPPPPANGPPHPAADRAAWELHNMTAAAAAVAAAALRREESRGAHFRADFPEPDAALDYRHLALVAGEWRLTTLTEARGRCSVVPNR